MNSIEIKTTLKQLIDKIMFNNSYGIKGAAFSCELTSIVYQGFKGEDREQLLELIEDFSIVDYGYSILEYNDKNKVFYYKD